MNKIPFAIFISFIVLSFLFADEAQAQCTPRSDWTNTYSVVRGDTLFRIAQRFGISSTDLAQGNCLTNTNLIYAGQTLRVPGTTAPQPRTARIPLSTSLFDAPGATVSTVTLQPGTVTVVGRSLDTNWLFVRTGNVQGWVWSYAVEIDNPTIQNLPIVNNNGSVDVPGTSGCNQYLVSRLSVGIQGRVLPGLPNNVRSTFSTSATLVGSLPADSLFTVTGGPQCAEGILWWQIQSGTLVGWTGELQRTAYWVEPVGAGSSVIGTVSAYVLNVRNAPGVRAAVLTRIRRWETYTVTGRLADNSWLQLNVNGTIGWVNARYITASNLNSVPIIIQ